ncbi:AMP-binding protein [Aquamicrobium sp.]|uniref:AMP-binding protein n=1 Tax=Aquamicrobium sp. TaxID=1872579 RepID=UPI002585CB27|nr:AMP-binding protein [Aquamicrobium sp.]MCK9553946.1 AMP-binding protein [Aquamicrobium sp.]
MSMTLPGTEMRRDVSGFSVRWNPAVAAMAADYGDWPNRTVAEFARDRASATPERIQLVDGDRALTAGELYDLTRRLAGWFEAIGLKAGDVVSFQLPNWWEANVINTAAAMLGVVVNPLVPIYRDGEISYMLNASGSKLIFIPELFRKFDYLAMMKRIAGNLEHPVRVVTVRGTGGERFEDILGAAKPLDGPQAVDPDAVKLILFTSGTTGRPKGVLHTHNSVHADGMKMVPALGLTSEDTVFCPSPITHVTGYLWVLNHPWLADLPAVTMDIWDTARAFDLLQQHRCAFMLGATPFLQGMIEEARRRQARLPFLRQYLCGGAAVPPSLIYEAAEIFENCIPWRNFGASEAMTMTRGPETRADLRLGAETDGRLLHCDVKIVDLATGKPVEPGEEGEILVREPSMAVGYARIEDNEVAYDEEGYFRMGDIVRLVDGDHVLVTGRKKDLIIRSGENISAKEIEDVLLASGIVADVAVVAKPSPTTGESICAFLVPRDRGAPTLAEIDAIIAGSGLAKQKTPEHLVVIEELPRTASGKVRKDVLRGLARDESRQETAT